METRVTDLAVVLISFMITAELYNTDRAKFDKTAQEYTKKVSKHTQQCQLRLFQ